MQTSSTRTSDKSDVCKEEQMPPERFREEDASGLQRTNRGVISEPPGRSWWGVVGICDTLGNIVERPVGAILRAAIEPLNYANVFLISVKGNVFCVFCVVEVAFSPRVNDILDSDYTHYRAEFGSRRRSPNGHTRSSYKLLWRYDK